MHKAAEIENLTPEQLTGYPLITSTTDTELRKEFMKLKDPDITALLDCARSFKSQLKRLRITCSRCGSRGGHSEETRIKTSMNARTVELQAK